MKADFESNKEIDGLTEMLHAIDRDLKSATSPDNFLHLAITYLNSGKFHTAEVILRLVVKQYPNDYDAFNILGVVLKNQRRYLEANNAFEQAVKINPIEVMAWINMGNSYVELKDYEEASRCFNRAVLCDARHYQALRLQGTAYARLKKNDLALKSLEMAVLYGKDNADVVYDYMAFHYNQGQYDKALEYFEQINKEFKELPSFARLKAMLLKASGRVTESTALLESIIANNPEDMQAMVFLAKMYGDVIGDMKKAGEYFTILYKKANNDPEILKEICHFLVANRGPDGPTRDNLSKAYEIALKILDLIKDDPISVAWILQSVFLHTLDYDSYKKLGDPKRMMNFWVESSNINPLLLQMSRVESMKGRIDLLDFHRAWGAAIEQKAFSNPIVIKPRKRLDSKIRIGIASSYLRDAPVAYFVLPLIEHLDRERFEIYCYCAHSREADAMQRSIMARVDEFRKYKGETKRDVAQFIANDQLDVLFELGGVTAYSLVESCAYKPAPVQVSWLGYPHSVGLPTTIDYIVVDPYLKPENNLIIEKPMVMPETWVSIDKSGFVQADITSAIPEDRNGYITFGTMNAIYKYTEEGIATWAQIMNMVPGSKFFCMRPDASAQVFQANFCKLMGRHGISADRIFFMATSLNHLDYYNLIDIAFDTFPHTGGTITCESLWMGTPVVTLVGPSFFERISYSNLNNCGLSDLCAFNLQQYKDITMNLIRDKERRRYLRNNLRTQIANHPLGQSRRFAENFGKAVGDVLGKSF